MYVACIVTGDVVSRNYFQCFVLVLVLSYANMCRCERDQ